MIEIIKKPISRSKVQELADSQFGDFVKAVVDVELEMKAIGAEMHSDEEASLIDDGSSQRNLRGINIYPSLPTDEMIEFDSMINIRPSQRNRSRDVEDERTKKKILEVVNSLVGE